MTIPFIKAHGAGNDFLLIREWPGAEESGYPALARALCDRRRGLGADGLIVFTGPARIRLFNSDGSAAELSGNGTRCAAAVLIQEGAAGPVVAIETGAGVKRLRLVERRGRHYVLEMGMGQPRYAPEEVDCRLETSLGPRRATILDVGNPQCALAVEDFDFDWRALGREIEGNPRFPCGSNVSFFRVMDRHTVESRFWERGAGETLSSGTGAAGAAVAAILSGRAGSPVRVITAGEDLEIRWEEELMLRGPAVLVARGDAER